MLAEKYANLEDKIPEMEPQRRMDPAPAPKKQAKTQQAPVRKRQTWKNVLTIGMVLLCFAAASFTIYRYSLITENHRAILALEKTLDEEKLRKKNLEVELSYREDLKNIEFSAAEMGMGYPKNGQVEYVNLPEPGISMEQADASASQSGQSLLKRLLGIFN